jgi:hypothetical protein
MRSGRFVSTTQRVSEICNFATFIFDSTLCYYIILYLLLIGSSVSRIYKFDSIFAKPKNNNDKIVNGSASQDLAELGRNTESPY